MSNTQPPQFVTYLPNSVTERGLRKLEMICTFITRFNAKLEKKQTQHSTEENPAYYHVITIKPWEDDPYYNNVDSEDFAWMAMEELHHRMLKAL